RPGADERRLFLDQLAGRHRRHLVHADRQRARSGDPRRLALGDEAGVERREVQAQVDAAAVAVLRPPGHRRRRRGAVHRVPRAAARRPAARAAVGGPMHATAAALAPSPGAGASGWNGLGPVLDFQLLHASGMDITIGGLIAALLVIALTW